MSFTFFVLQQQQNLERRFGTSKIYFSPPHPQWCWLLSVLRIGCDFVDSLLILTPIFVGFCNCNMFCCALLCLHSSFAIIPMGKREMVTLLCLSSRCLVIVGWLFLTGLSAVCDCGISRSYSLTIFRLSKTGPLTSSSTLHSVMIYWSVLGSC